jgi:hypothetical protein
LSFDGDLYPTAGATSVMTTKGDMVDFNTARQRLGIGNASDVLTVSAGLLPTWTAPASSSSLWAFQGEVDLSTDTEKTITLSSQIAPASGFLFGRFIGLMTSANPFDMQVGDTGGLETGTTYNTIGQWTNTSGTAVNFSAMNQVRFTFMNGSFADANQFESDCFLHVTQDGSVVTSNRMSTQIGWGTWGGINPSTGFTSGISQVKIFGGGANTATGKLQFWSCSTS